MTKASVFLVDATAFCYRAFYALRELSTSFGQPTNAIYGFLNMLNRLLKERRPEFLGMCFDVSRDNFRTRKFSEYKIQRPPMPEALSNQISLIKEVTSAYGIAIFEKEGYEADDIIATLSRKARDSGLGVIIISSDKDMLQLIDEVTVVFNPYKNKGLTYDKEAVLKHFGVKPKQINDILALAGDDADNLPGVPGIGEKTATELIQQFGSLEELLGNTDKIKSDKIKHAITGSLDKIKLNKELIVLDDNIDIDLDLNGLKIAQPNLKELARLFKYLEFKKFLQDLPAEDGGAKEDIALTELGDRDLRPFLESPGEIVLYGQALGSLIFYSKDRLFRVKNPGVNLKSILACPQIKKIGHDLKKIRVSLARDNIVFAGLYFDTMVAGYLLNPSRPAHDLASLAWDYLGNRQPGSSLSNEKAVGLIYQLKLALEKELRDKLLLSLFNDIEMPLVEVLADMELGGIKLNLRLLKRLSEDIEKGLIDLIRNIYEVSGCEFNINSPKQLRAILFERLKLPVGRKSKTGPSTNEEVLRNLATKHELPALLLRYRQLTKLKSTYVDALPALVDRDTGRVHSSFNQVVTETGRLSSSNPNLQNIPVKTDIGRQIRRAIVAYSQDSCLLSCDYSQIELRILAHISRDTHLISAFHDNRDIHKATASLVYGLDEKGVNEQMRETAKRVNFGIIYGLTSYGLSRDLGIPVDQAQGFIDAYFLRYPKVKEYIQEQIKKAQRDGFVTTIAGRRRYLPQINSKNQLIRQLAQRQAVNTPIQGSASDLIKLAMVNIHRQVGQENLPIRMILQIHDELVFDIPKADKRGFVELLRQKMENVWQLEVPIKVDIKQGENWLDMEEVK